MPGHRFVLCVSCGCMKNLSCLQAPPTEEHTQASLPSLFPASVFSITVCLLPILLVSFDITHLCTAQISSWFPTLPSEEQNSNLVSALVCCSPVLTTREQRNDTPGWPVPVPMCYKLLAVPIVMACSSCVSADRDREEASSARELLSAWPALQPSFRHLF